jgi:hypothetical protein
MTHTVNVGSAGAYTITASVASIQTGGTFHLEFGPVGQVGGSGVTNSGVANLLCRIPGAGR